MNDQLQIWIDNWVYQYFAPEVKSYCDILLNRINPMFLDLDGEEKRAAEEFLAGIPSHGEEDHDAIFEAAYDHARDHVWRFMELQSVFLTVGVSGLFHLFERQLYRHINKELDRWLTTPIADWRDLESMIPKFNRKYGEECSCSELVDAFRDSDLQELRLVANTVKHGDDGSSYKQLVARGARVVDARRLADDGNIGRYSILKVNVSVQVDDVERYRDAILRFWSVKGTFCAHRSAFG